MGKRATLASVLLHEIVTDMALALGWDWLFSAFIDGVTALGVRPGFNTRNLPRLVRQLQDWRISTRDLAFAAPFNSVGFQMCPSRAACEDALATIPEAFVIAISVLAAGYLQPAEAAAYTASLPNLSGVALGVSRIDYARESFTAFDASVKKQSAA
jgi:hypothetical protein